MCFKGERTFWYLLISSPLFASALSVLRRNVSASDLLCWSIKEQQGSQQDLLAQQAQAVQRVINYSRASPAIHNSVSSSLNFDHSPGHTSSLPPKSQPLFNMGSPDWNTRCKEFILTHNISSKRILVPSVQFRKGEWVPYSTMNSGTGPTKG